MDYEKLYEQAKRLDEKLFQLWQSTGFHDTYLGCLSTLAYSRVERRKRKMLADQKES